MLTRLLLVMLIALSLGGCSFLAGLVTKPPAGGNHAKLNMAKNIEEVGLLKSQAEILQQELSVLKLQHESYINAQRDYIDNSKVEQKWYNVLLGYLNGLLMMIIVLYGFIWALKSNPPVDKK